MRLITLNPAIQLGIQDRVGSLEEGKDGDIAIFNHHPLSIYAIPQYTIVDGIVRFNVNEDQNDMRMDIDPEVDISTFIDHAAGEDHRCMQGVFEFFDAHK